MLLSLPLPVLRPWQWKAQVLKRRAWMQALAVLAPPVLAWLPVPQATCVASEAHPFRLQLLGLVQLLPALTHVQEEVRRPQLTASVWKNPEKPNRLAVMTKHMHYYCSPAAGRTGTGGAGGGGFTGGGTGAVTLPVSIG